MNLLRGIGYGVTLWIFAMIYVVPLKHKKSFAGRAAFSLLGVCAVSILMYFLKRSGLGTGLAIMAVSYLLLAAIMMICTDVSAAGCFYYGTWALVSQQIIYEMWQVLYDLSAGTGWIPNDFRFRIIGGILFYIASFCLCAATIARWLPEKGQFRIGPRQLTSSVIILLIFELLTLVLFYGEAPMMAKNNWSVIFLVQIFCIMLLYLQNELFKKSAIRQELITMNLLWHQQKAQYNLAKENITFINRKCHDLKHQINALRHIVSKEEREKYLDEIEDSVRIYDAIVKTGNEVLDTILTEKSLYCKENGIQISCVADGSQMDFIHPVDLYTILGNALDNAIEGIQSFKQQEKRQIDVLIYRQQQFLVIQIINPTERELKFEDNLPVTTKGDNGYHGFGLKSIRHTVKKYDGFLRVGVQDGCFSLKIIITIPEHLT